MLAQETPWLRGNPTDMRGSCDMANIKRGNGIHRHKARFSRGFLARTADRMSTPNKSGSPTLVPYRTDRQTLGAHLPVTSKGYTLEKEEGEVGGALAQRHFRSESSEIFPSKPVTPVYHDTV